MSAKMSEGADEITITTSRGEIITYRRGNEDYFHATQEGMPDVWSLSRVASRAVDALIEARAAQSPRSAPPDDEPVLRKPVSWSNEKWASLLRGMADAFEGKITPAASSPPDSAPTMKDLGASADTASPTRDPIEQFEGLALELRSESYAEGRLHGDAYARGEVMEARREAHDAREALHAFFREQVRASGSIAQRVQDLESRLTAALGEPTEEEAERLADAVHCPADLAQGVLTAFVQKRSEGK